MFGKRRKRRSAFPTNSAGIVRGESLYTNLNLIHHTHASQY